MSKSTQKVLIVTGLSVIAIGVVGHLIVSIICDRLVEKAWVTRQIAEGRTRHEVEQNLPGIRLLYLVHSEYRDTVDLSRLLMFATFGTGLVLIGASRLRSEMKTFRLEPSLMKPSTTQQTNVSEA